MRTSQTALLSAAGVVLAGLIVAIGLSRLAMGGAEAGERSAPAFSSGPVNQSVDLTGFDQVVVRGAWHVEIEQGEQWQVTLEYTPRRSDGPVAEVRDGRLILEAGNTRGGDWGGWFGNDDSPVARIVMPALAGVQVTGTSNLEFEGFRGEQLDFDLSGAANIEAYNSTYDRLDLTVSGAGRVDLRRADFRDANIDISGAALVEITMTGGVLSGSLSGFGNVNYYGEVEAQRVDVSGFSRIQAVD